MNIPHKRDSVTHEVPETDETIVHDTQGNELLVLNPVGAAVWCLIDGQRSVDDIAAFVAGQFDADVNTQRVRHDVQRFIETMSARGLVYLL